MFTLQSTAKYFKKQEYVIFFIILASLYEWQ